MADPKGWELFYSCFKEGDEVVVIDVNDKFWWGRFHDLPGNEFELRTDGRVWVLDVNEIRFMAHDGFPVRKVLGAEGSSTIEQIDTEDTQAAIRQALRLEYPEWEQRTVGHVRFADPFDIENVNARLYHPGNSGLRYWSRFWSEAVGYFSDSHREAGYEDEECLVLTSRDGAKAELWDLTTVYCFE